MSVDRNKELARRVFDEIWSEGKLELADKILAPDFVGRPGGLGHPFRGPEGAKQFIGRLREGFPDITFTVEDMIAEGDLVATRWTGRGSHDGEFMGLEPTGDPVTFGGMTFLRFEDTWIVEGWTQPDALVLLQQIGAVPEPARA
jgi:predicted ester cyclase